MNQSIMVKHEEKGLKTQLHTNAYPNLLVMNEIINQ
jgi:hypothetical protein